MKVQTLTKIERVLRPLMRILPSKFFVSSYSGGRIQFMESLDREYVDEVYFPPKILERKLCGFNI